MDFSAYKQLEFRRKFFRIFGAEIDITDPSKDEMVGFIEMQAWKLREDIRLYSNKSKSQELFRIHARSIIDFGVTYDVFDSQTNEQLFSVRRQGLRSTFVRDQWEIKGADDDNIGLLKETSSSLAIIRRYTDLIPVVGPVVDLAMSFWPVTYSVYDQSGKVAANLVQQRNPLIVKFQLIRTDEQSDIDARVPIALTALLSVLDASKN